MAPTAGMDIKGITSHLHPVGTTTATVIRRRHRLLPAKDLVSTTMVTAGNPLPSLP
ncbi:hypothetical protein H7F10_15020 [Acidithiobacillus sp. HP-6]|uniref:hypothetical protein n=1 Tax=unclassified Acidithiobacillus TaxID=2614800 RepID=UPI00187903E0|nr:MULTISPECIES: hypothetical protein [unclassified Acidithiobacillus]MBE7564208.1 hypothetical protein [Acidithiobacillus sp. HP-6]MBE7569126.1 hypothetical protein [Acidithiobacillus sp. HP-2]